MVPSGSTKRHGRSLLLLFAVTAGTWDAHCLPTSADVVELATGGRIEGRIIESPNGNTDTFVVDLPGGGQVTVSRSHVSQVEATSATEAEYKKLAQASADTVEAHWELAEWCRERKLRDAAQQHLTRILELDPNHEQARAILGFRRMDGEWKTRDALMAARGMVMYEGRYVTRQHVELMDQQKALKASQADWGNWLELRRRWLTGRRQDRSAQALADIQSISDPLAAEAVVELLHREHNLELKRLWMEVAARLNHPTAIDALVQLSLYDDEPEIRHQSLEYLIRTGRRGLTTPYARALKDRNNEIVNRAGAALGQIGDASAAGPLVDALLTNHRFKVVEGNPGQQAYTFSPQGSGYSFGGSGPKYEWRPLRNPEVLAALVKLADGASFDYDQGQWRRWLAAQTKQHVVDVRRDE